MVAAPSLIRGMGGQRELNAGTGAALGLPRNLPAIALHDLLADGQADAVARVFSAGVQTLKDYKNVFRVLGRNSDSVIVHAEQPSQSGFFRLHRNHRRLFPAKLDGVPN